MCQYLPQNRSFALPRALDVVENVPMTSGQRSYSLKTLKLLWGTSGSRCAFNNCCRKLLVEPATSSDSAAIVGEICHIVPHSMDTKAPRQDPTIPKDKRNQYENLILLCPTHHTIIDKQPNSYTAADLRQWKADHERWVRQSLESAAIRVSFNELAELSKHLEPKLIQYEKDFGSVTLDSKIKKNNLSSVVSDMIKYHVGNTLQVQEYVSNRTKYDPTYPDRLKATFIRKYNTLVDVDELTGDALFYGLASFASANTGDSDVMQAAGLAFLVYLFEICDVFER